MDDLGSLLSDPPLRSRLDAHLAGGPPAGLLRSLKLKIISNCNLKCEMCRYWRITKAGLSLEVIARVLDSAAGMGCRKVHLSGGEVTLHHDLPAAIRHGARLGMRVNLTSNGVLMQKARAREWIDTGLHAASFSLDGARAKMHDQIRGVPGAFKRTLRGIRVLKREVDRAGSKLRIRVNTVLSQKNLFELPNLIRLAGELGAIDVVPMPIDGNYARPSPEEIREFNRSIVPEVVALRRQYGMPLDVARFYPFGRSEDEIACGAAGDYDFGYYREHTCYAPWLHMFVSHTGDVFACCMSRERMESLGNVKTTPLDEIFRGEKYEAFRQRMLVSRLPICAHCDQFLPENKLVARHLGEAARPRMSLPILEPVAS